MSFSELVSFLAKYINTYSGLPGIIFFLIFLTKKGNVSWYAFYILLASFLADFGNDLFLRYVYPNSFIISNSWYLINYVIVTLLFAKLVPRRKKLLLILGAIFILGGTASFIFLYSFLEANTFIRTYSSLAFTILSILAFYEILKEGPTNALIDYPVFWILTGIFLLSSVGLLRNLFNNYLIFQMEASWELVSYVSFFGILFNILKNLMFLYAFVLIKKGNPDYIVQPPNVTA